LNARYSAAPRLNLTQNHKYLTFTDFIHVSLRYSDYKKEGSAMYSELGCSEDKHKMVRSWWCFY